VSNRRAQDERIEGTPDGSNAITEIVDVPDAPTIGTATADIFGASVPFTAATTGGTPSLYTATSTPGSITGTSATSPITVSGLTVGTAYTFTVTPSNSTGTGPASSSSNSITPVDLISAYDALSAVTLSEATSSVTFAGIPAEYDHLQIRVLARNSSANSAVAFYARYNSDTGSNYYLYHLIAGTGSGTPGSNAGGAGTEMLWGDTIGTTGLASAFGTSIIDILDYSNTNKNKTSRVLYAQEQNGGGTIAFASNLWRSTAAVNYITLFSGIGNFAQHSSFALYGVK
jgi:hypothetical protein